MRKIVYKSIFSIVIMLFVFLMLPNKQVKAQEQEEQTFPKVIMKVPYYFASWDNEYTFTYEFTIKYRLNNLVYPLNDSLNENDYFLIVTTGLAIQKGITSTSLAYSAYELKEIQIEDNYTIFSIRLVIPKTTVDSLYGGPEYMFVFFKNDSAFYIKYNVYQYGYDLGYMDGHMDGYGDGFSDGRDYGKGIGYQEGRVEGWSEGYCKGYDNGHKDGYNQGYEKGFEDGDLYGYDIGYDIGYDKGYNKGIEQSYDVGYNDGYQEGYDDGINTNNDYMLGYNDGFRAGEESKIAQNSEAFYKSIEKWLVPAIITVILLGGIVSIIAIKRREQ